MVTIVILIVIMIHEDADYDYDYDYHDHHAPCCPDLCPGYYRCLRCLTESRLPSCVEQSDAATPPSALADTVLMLMTRPLTLDTDNRSPFAYVCTAFRR